MIKVSFSVPTLNAASMLPRFLGSIRSQLYPQELVEIVVADGGSTDDTLRIAADYGAVVAHNPLKLPGPGGAVGYHEATGEVVFFGAADNVLCHRDWLRYMVKPFEDDPTILVVFTKTAPAPDSNAFDNYFNQLHTDPLSWFIYEKTAHPDGYGRMYKTLRHTDDYVVYDFRPETHPIIGLAQGCGLRRSFKIKPENENDDILQIIQVLQEGGRLAYVRKAGIYHYSLQGFGHFLRKFRWKIRNSLAVKYEGMGLVAREPYLSPSRKLRKYLFLPYSLSMVLPIVDSLRMVVAERDRCMLWHAPACFALAVEILIEYARYKLARETTIGDYGNA
jgi:glycosyltransferase involved in cell wall biosynthesis